MSTQFECSLLMLLSCWINKSIWSSTTIDDLYLSYIINFCTLDLLELVWLIQDVQNVQYMYICASSSCHAITMWKNSASTEWNVPNPAPEKGNKVPQKWIFWMPSRFWIECHLEIWMLFFFFFIRILSSFKIFLVEMLHLYEFS